MPPKVEASLKPKEPARFIEDDLRLSDIRLQVIQQLVSGEVTLPNGEVYGLTTVKNLLSEGAIIESSGTIVNGTGQVYDQPLSTLVNGQGVNRLVGEAFAARYPDDYAAFKENERIRLYKDIGADPAVIAFIQQAETDMQRDYGNNRSMSKNVYRQLLRTDWLRQYPEKGRGYAERSRFKSERSFFESMLVEEVEPETS